MERKCNQCNKEWGECKLDCTSRRVGIAQLIIVGAITVFVALDQGIIIDDVASKDVPTIVSSRR